VEAPLVKVRRKTIVLGLAAVTTTWLNVQDPARGDDGSVPFVSNRSAARRVFPDLSEHAVAEARFTFVAPDGPSVRIDPVPDGPHRVTRGEELLGPVDPEALDGIWASLRMATTLRAVSKGTQVGTGGGEIRVEVGGREYGLALGGDAPDGSGVYGVLRHEEDAPWVVEDELVWLVRQPAEAWVLHSLADVATEELRRVAWGDSTAIARGADDRWRAEQGERRVLLSTQAVELRLDRLLGARFDPLIERSQAVGEAAPWLVVGTESSQALALVSLGPCPGHPDRILVDRGPGRLGCVEDSLTGAWDPLAAETGLLETRLVPYAFSSVIGIEMSDAADEGRRRRLRRRTGGWLLDDGARTVEVDEDAVARWYDEFSQLEAALLAVDAEPIDPATTATWPIALRVELGPELALEMRCEPGLARCRRAEGPVLDVLGVARPDLRFDQETFAERRLFTLGPGEARSLEIRPVTDGGVRQALRIDLGSWRLDHPAHPDAAGAIDEVRLERMLGALVNARARAWVDHPQGSPLRTIGVESVPDGPTASTLTMTIFDDCVVTVPDKRAAVLDERTCAAVSGDLLFADPVRFWLDRARSVTVRRSGAEPAQIRRVGDAGWTDLSGAPISAELEEALALVRSLESVGLRSGDPTGPRQMQLTIRRDENADVEVDVGADWARIAGADWHYALRQTAG
jgi:hypothetical protein